MECGTVILGAGFVGQRLADKLGKCTITHRQILPSYSVHEQIEFRLQDDSTWSTLPDLTGRDVVITFSTDVAPLETLQRFHAQCLVNAKSIIVLGTTGILSPSEPSGLANEESSRSGVGFMGQSLVNRIQGEDFLLQQGATVLALSGIAGDTRSVGNWLKRGFLRNGSKLINVVYVQDILYVISYFLDHPSPGQRYVVNGGWYQIQELCKHFGYPLLPELPTDLTSKKMSAEKLLQVLPKGFKFCSVFDEPSVERESLKTMWNTYKSKHFRSWYGSVIMYEGGNSVTAEVRIEEEFQEKSHDEFQYFWKYLTTSGNSTDLEKLMDPKCVISFKSVTPFGILLPPFRLFCFSDGDFIKAPVSFNGRADFSVCFGFLLDSHTRAIVSCTYRSNGTVKNYVLFREETTAEVSKWTSDNTIEREPPSDLIPQTRLTLGDGCQVVTNDDAPSFLGYAHLDGITDVHTLYLPQGFTLSIPKLLIPRRSIQLAAWCERPDGCVVQLKCNYGQTSFDSILHDVEKRIYII